jgi:hypothetical protein
MVGSNFADDVIVAVVAEYNLEETVAAVFENTADNYPVDIAAEHLLMV